MSGILTFRRPQAVATRRWVFVIVASLNVAGCGWVGHQAASPVPTHKPPSTPGEGRLPSVGGSLLGPGECPAELCGGPPAGSGPAK